MSKAFSNLRNTQTRGRRITTKATNKAKMYLTKWQKIRGAQLLSLTTVQKCLIYQMSTPKRRQHLSSSMTMMMAMTTTRQGPRPRPGSHPNSCPSKIPLDLWQCFFFCIFLYFEKWTWISPHGIIYYGHLLRDPESPNSYICLMNLTSELSRQMVFP